MLKDSRNIMWFGTDKGLYSYDGTNVNYYCHRMGDSNSLPTNGVLQITKDKDGKIWAALLTGIAEIDPSTGKCITYTGLNHRIDANNFTNKICIDNSDNVWVGNSVGIFLLDKKQNRFINIWNNKVNNNPRGSYVTSIVNANKHLLIASTFHDLVFLNKDNYSFRSITLFHQSPDKDTGISSVFLDSHQRLWIGTYSGGVYVYDLAKGRITTINKLQPLLAHPYVLATSFYEADFHGQEYIWISTNIGLIKCLVNDTSLEDYTYYRHDENTKSTIIPGKLNCLYFDSDGALWCIADEGICRCYPFRNNFRFFASVPRQIQDIQQISLQGHNYFTISSWNGDTTGLKVMDNEGKKAPFSINLTLTDKMDGKNISSVIQDKYDRLWVASMAGISVLNNKLQIIKQWDKNTTGNDKLSYHRINAIAIHNDTVWIAGYNKGVDLFDMSFKKIAHYDEASNSGLTDNIIYYFFTDSHGNFWLCGNSELYKYSIGRKFKPYPLTSEAAGCNPHEICETKDGDLIISSASGLIRFNPVSEKYSYIATDLLLKEREVNSAAIDWKDEIWFLTNEHLVCYQPKQKLFILFGKEDGLDISRGLNELRTFNGKDFYICQKDQVIKFNCDSLYQPEPAPNLIINLTVNDSAIAIGKSTQEIQLPYDKNKVQIEFTGVSYIKPDQNRYFYKLSGIDTNWNITYKNSVAYANLSPGNYNFKVKTQNYAGIMSAEKIIHFIIHPPYWRTWWFRTIIAVTSLFLLFILIRYISQRNLKMKILQIEKEAAVEKERNRIAQDMHDDLGSGLTKIAILSELAESKLKHPEEASTQLKRIADSSRDMVDSLQDIIWMLNTENDRLDMLAEYIKEYATKYVEHSEISLSFDYPKYIEPVKLSEVKRRNIFLAVKEALNNISKYAGAKNINIRLGLQKNNFFFSISDDGKGFDTKRIRTFGNGIKNMHARMEQSGGACTIDSIPDKGTTVKLYFS